MARADAYAVHVAIGPLLAKLHGHLPWTGYSLRPFAVAALVNDLIINHRRAYLEFGGGVSTVLVAKAAELAGADVELVTVESDPAWRAVLEAMLAHEELGGRVRFLTCPLVERPSPFGPLRWYDEQLLLAGLAGRRSDLVLVDGPPAGGRSASRYPALPFLQDHGLLAEDASIMLDDVDRPAELAILRRWSSRWRVPFQRLHGRVAWAVAPHSFDAQLD